MPHKSVEPERRAIPSIQNVYLDAPPRVDRGRTPLGYERLVRDRRGQRLTRSVRLRNAIEMDELSLHYQPQFELRDGRQCGVEALARWSLPNGESIAPATFIPVAEKNGLITALGAWVLRKACTTVAAWNSNGELPPILCVNVSPRQISRNFGAMLASTLERTGFPAAQLELEITEGILINKPQLALDCLAQWKDLGVRIALDDFGTGYSSLSYLSRLPVDRVKIDRSLVHRVLTEPKTAAIVRAIVSLGADLGFEVLAEGVESEAQLAMLRGMGCQQAQGYLLALPACAEETRTLLTSSWGRRPMGRSFPEVRSDGGSLRAI